MKNNYHYLTSGLVHNIYTNDRYIYKRVKQRFNSYQNKNHFQIEKMTLDLLKNQGFNTPEYIKICSYYENKKIKYSLKENFIAGNIYGWNELTHSHLTTFLQILNKAHSIKLTGYGLLNSSGVGSYPSWGNYIADILKPLESNLELFKFSKKEYTKIKKIEEAILYKSKNLSSNFVFVDLNPGNIIFSNSTPYIIDIDHAISGDYLWDYATIKWYSPKTFLKISKFKNFRKSINLICYYELLHGINTVVWSKSHDLPVANSVKKLSNLLSSIDI